MFLKRAYKENRGLFLLFTAFAVIQLYVLIEPRVQISPFYKYGMFSRPYREADTIKVVEISLGDKTLMAKDYSPHRWDNLMYPVEAIHRYRGATALFSRLAYKLWRADTTEFYNPLSEAEMWERYGHHISYLSGVADTPLRVRKAYYIWEHNQTIKVKSELLYED